jgi:(p)ppGpp synthase/HD superfamily hydrolase
MFSVRLERALRLAASAHQGQTRKVSGVPYVEHLIAVAWILDRAGFAEDVVIAGLLHDIVEDTSTTLEELRLQFGQSVAEWVAHCSEMKTDALGQKRPWIDRKRDHLAALATAPWQARAVALADKLHNLISIEVDLNEGYSVWSAFHADRDQVLWYYQAMIECCGQGDSRFESLAAQCQVRFEAIQNRGARRADSGGG